MATENKIGGLTEKQIQSEQNACPIFRTWSGGERDFCDAQCAWKAVPRGKTATCPHVDASEADTAIPRTPLMVSIDVLERDKRGETVFDGSGAKVVGNGRAEITNYRPEESNENTERTGGFIYQAMKLFGRE